MKILVVNGTQTKGIKPIGKLNNSLSEVSKQVLTELGHEVTETIVEQGYDPEIEADKFIASDVIIFHFPIWWFGQPWTVKKYIDEVYTVPFKFYQPGTRNPSNPNPNIYGKNGFLQNKRVMINTTQAAPLEAYTNPTLFMEGHLIDELLRPIYLQNKFVGINDFIPGFHIYDVYVDTNIKLKIDEYKEHLKKYFN